jgi:2-amino-4-hydroxy-6-hydroxymethyldihydropteridine diphosphokinase
MSVAYLAFGANLGDRLATIEEAIDRVRALGRSLETAPVYETDPVGYADQPRYLNTVGRLETNQPPHILLHRLLAIEQELGRVRTFRNAARTIDLDLLLYDDLAIDSVDLILPHPRMHLRAFVLFPLADLAPDLIHPLLRKTIGELAEPFRGDPGLERYVPVAQTGA